MTTNEMVTRPQHFTDVEALWDVECEMTVEYGYGAMNLSHSHKPYLAPYENATRINKLPDGSAADKIYTQNNYSVVGGLYVVHKV